MSLNTDIGSVSRDFHRSVFSSNNTSWASNSWAKAFWILLRIRRNMIDFRTQKLIMRCQRHRMHGNFLPLKIYLFFYWWGRTIREHICFFLQIFLLKVARAVWIVSQSCMRCHILHAGSMTPHSPCMQCQWPRMHCACSVIDTVCTILRSKIDHILANRSRIQNGFSSRVLFDKKPEDRKSPDTVPLTH
jgi:hypothetical protein